MSHTAMCLACGATLPTVDSGHECKGYQPAQPPSEPITLCADCLTATACQLHNRCGLNGRRFPAPSEPAPKRETPSCSLNDTDLSDAELIAALYDMTLDIKPDADSVCAGTLLERVEAAIRGWDAAQQANDALRKEMAELQKVREALTQQLKQSSEVGAQNDLERDSLKAQLEEADRNLSDARHASRTWMNQLADAQAKIAELEAKQ